MVSPLSAEEIGINTEAEAAAERYRLELTDLQDIAFMAENGVAEEPASEKTNAFPIRTDKKVVSSVGIPRGATQSAGFFRM